jgi:type I restriction enzyme M protein
MQITEHSRQLGQFFTKSSVGDFMIGQLETSGKPRVLDLGAGDGSLALAIRRRWKKASITTLDIDETVEGRIRTSFGSSSSSHHRHVTADALDEHLPALLSASEFELAVCNPPYMRVQWRESFRRILGEVGLGELHALPSDVLTSEVMFIAQVLRLAREGAEIGLIVPDGLISGLRARPIREALLSRTNVRKIVQLPRGSFRHTDAQAHVIILRNEPSSGGKIRIGSLSSTGENSVRLISTEDAARRMDWNFYSTLAPLRGASLRQLGATVTRGSLSSKEARAFLSPVFHTTNFKDTRSGVAYLAGGSVPSGPTTAEPGDILLARVDRNLEEKVCMVHQGSATITDCILRIRLPEELRQKAFVALTSSFGKDAIRRAARGVGARMLGKEDLLDMELLFT